MQCPKNDNDVLLNSNDYEIGSHFLFKGEVRNGDCISNFYPLVFNDKKLKITQKRMFASTIFKNSIIHYFMSGHCKK